MKVTSVAVDPVPRRQAPVAGISAWQVSPSERRRAAGLARLRSVRVSAVRAGAGSCRSGGLSAPRPVAVPAARGKCSSDICTRVIVRGSCHVDGWQGRSRQCRLLSAGLLLLAVGYDVIGKLTHPGQRDTDAN